MCGLCGIVAGKSQRSKHEISRITDVFTRLLIYSEHRGPFDTGIASIESDEQTTVVKQHSPTRLFVNTDKYRSWLGTIHKNTTYLMGHTRWPTRGSIYNPENNHPLMANVCTNKHSVLLTHNGSIRNVDHHFRRLNLPRTAQVDSELLLRIAQRYSGENGINVEAFIENIRALDGRMSLAMAATSKPDEVILLKGNMPLEVWYHPTLNVLIYASETSIINTAVGKVYGWIGIPIKPMTMLTIKCSDLSTFRLDTVDTKNFGCIDSNIAM